MFFRRALASCLFALLAQTGFAEDIAATKSDDVRRLIEVTGSTKISAQFASAISQQMFKTLKKTRPDIPERVVAVMERELMLFFAEKMSAPGGLIEQTIPIYEKHFTHQEIRELIAFYQTPVGKKAIAVLPQVMSDSMEAGQRWGQSLGPEIEQRIIRALIREGLFPGLPASAPSI